MDSSVALNMTSLGGKEPELAWKFEKYRLDVTGLTFKHDLRSKTKSLKGRFTGSSGLIPELPCQAPSSHCWMRGLCPCTFRQSTGP